MAITTKAEALAILIDYASRYGENFEEQFPRRLDANDSDTVLTLLAADADELEDMVGIRDLWKAIALLQGGDNEILS